MKHMRWQRRLLDLLLDAQVISLAIWIRTQRGPTLSFSSLVLNSAAVDASPIMKRLHLSPSVPVSCCKRVKREETRPSKEEVIDAAEQRSNDQNFTDLTNLLPKPSTRPRFKGQQVIDSDGITWLDDTNCLITAYNVLNEEGIRSYLTGASSISRFVGKSAFNSMKPRREICYTTTGEPYVYSNRQHPTQMYPPHVLTAIPFWMQCVERHLPAQCYRKLSHGIDIVYGPEFDRGGSAGAHGDNELPWGLVIIFSLGQTRYLRVRRRSNKEFINVEMRHNSVIAMHGASFQWKYTHQVDKLPPTEEIFTRLTCNVRFLED